MKIKVKRGLIINKMGDSYVAYDNDTSILHELNETGYFILQDLQKGKPRPETIRRLVKYFKTTQKEVGKDYDDFVRLLDKKALIILQQKRKQGR